MQKKTLLTYLDTYLAHEQFPGDTSANGLQVDTNKQEIKKIGYAVDVTTYLIDKAIEAEVDIMLTHHGMFR
jgi:putative NIF3 family GTP cyclohydrolase 1 type 2